MSDTRELTKAERQHYPNVVCKNGLAFEAYVENGCVVYRRVTSLETHDEG